MNSSTRGDPSTPRRSTRIQQKREKTPEPSHSAYKPRGPRAMAKLNRANKSVPSIVISSPTKDVPNEDPVQGRDAIKAKTVKDKTETEAQKEVPAIKHEAMDIDESQLSSATEIKDAEMGTVESIEVKKEAAESAIQQNLEKHETYAEVVAHGEPEDNNKGKECEDLNKQSEPLTCPQSELPRTELNPDVKDSEGTSSNNAEPKQPETATTDKPNDLLNTTPLLFDESIISVPESVDNTIPPKDATFSPEPIAAVPQTKDSTFSPVIDKSLHDTRPHIDLETEFNTTPIQRNITHRTSTPLAQKIMKRETPKAGTSAMSSLVKMMSPKVTANVVEALNDTVNGQFKLVNPLEKSILKSTRKRSLSVADGESFVQKRVMFISPKVMDIGEIDERMMQSFREEKENSMMKAQLASGSRRKRSMSASETPVPKKTPKKQMPDFKAIHEAQFKKMESILEHKNRKAERAKRLITPSKSLPVTSNGESSNQSQAVPVQSQPAKVAALSKIPTAARRPLAVKPQVENAQAHRPVKRSMSAEPQTTQIKKPAFVPTLARAASQSEKPKIKFPLISQPRIPGKTEERREKNMSRYKTNATRTGNIGDFRKNNENVLKGVRLNRRFELQMQNRQAHGSKDAADN